MEFLVCSQLIIDTGLLILIWLVQLIIYPSFRYIADDCFHSWHSRYVRAISLIVVPLSLSQLAVEIVYTIYHSSRWLRISIIALIWVSTFTLSAPCHARLQQEGKQGALIERLISTNWIRTLLWTLLFLHTTTLLIRPLKV